MAYDSRILYNNDGMILKIGSSGVGISGININDSSGHHVATVSKIIADDYELLDDAIFIKSSINIKTNGTLMGRARDLNLTGVGIEASSFDYDRYQANVKSRGLTVMNPSMGGETKEVTRIISDDYEEKDNSIYLHNSIDIKTNDKDVGKARTLNLTGIGISSTSFNTGTKMATVNSKGLTIRDNGTTVGESLELDLTGNAIDSSSFSSATKKSTINIVPKWQA